MEAFEDKKEFIIVTEYLEGGELFEKIVEEGELLESDCCFYIRQVCQVSGSRNLQRYVSTHLENNKTKKTPVMIIGMFKV